MSDKAIHIIGLGVAETAELGVQASQVIQAADVVIGAERQLATVEHLLLASTQSVILPKLSQLQLLIDSHTSETVVVLASGDPLFYGIGRWFVQRFEFARLRFYPAVSSLQAACHRLGVAMQDVDVVSLHGRPIVSIRSHLKHRRRLLLLTDKDSQPQRLAQECIRAGFTDSIITVCENLGYQSRGLA